MNAIPYGRQWIDKDDIAAVAEVLDSELITQGPKAEEFERKLCELTGAKYCVVLANGTAALHLAVAALEIKKGLEGITSSNTFVATPNSLIYNGLKPVFADIDPRTFCITPQTVKAKLTDKTKIVMPVHFAGQSADVKGIRETVGKNIFIVEDAAHAIGSFDAQGNPVGSCRYSDAAILSFHPVKTITSGEGGAVTTNNPEIYEKLIQLRIGGITKKPELLSKNPGPWYYEMQRLGFNYRMTDFQAALGLSQLKKLEKFVARRNEIILAYNTGLAGIKHLTLPYTPKELKSAFHLYVTRIDFGALGINRADFINALIAKYKIGTQVHYIPVHTQPYYRENFGCKDGDLPDTENYYQCALSLPLYPKMTDAEVRHVIEHVKEFTDK
ncbi:MAG: UDP-4-amino-4,6-dideoxy-N-acetyl-beta-L-altrosamine transaminase [Elusimicrobiaceae bacterium]